MSDPDQNPAPTPEDRYQKLAESLWNDSDLGATVRKRAKSLFPDIVIPEDSAEPLIAPIRAELEAMRAERIAEKEAAAKEKEERAQAKAQTKLEDMLVSARQKYSLSDEGFDKMCERMKATSNYSDAEAAAAWVAQQNPPAPPPRAYLGPQKANFYGTGQADEERFGLLHRDPFGAFLDAEMTEFMNDPDKYVRDAGF
jgi:hypothetical protein